MSFDQDTRGILKLKESLTRMGAAYHLGLDKKSTAYISLGLQFLNTARSIDKLGIISPGTIVN